MRTKTFILCLLLLISFSSQAKKPDSKFEGVQVGAITYSYRSMERQSLADILEYIVASGISSVELMGDPVEEFLGRPVSADQEVVREWRKMVSMDKVKEIKRMFNRKGVNIHILKMANSTWSDEEIDYAFNVCKTLGAKGVSMEIGEANAKRMVPFAAKHRLYVIFHNHGQPGRPDFSFEHYLAYSPWIMLNFDAGHYFGATGIHPNELITRLHDRIFSIHIKDKTSKNNVEPNVNRPFGEGDTPIGDILQLIKKEKWPLYCDIELEYSIPHGSDAVKEVSNCVEYCRKALLQIPNSLSAIPDTARIEYNKMIFGQFIEHFHTQVYGGIYDPASEFSDRDGFRTDVIQALKEIKMPIIRWPGGCFVSSYHWMDGVGKERTPVYDKTWQVEDPNTFGTDEFVEWCKKVGTEPYICTNAGTGSPEEMSNWVEYCNLNMGKYARMRKTNGYPDPYHVKYWSIGNENYGSWELGAHTAEQWGPMVRESAKLMRSVSPDIKLFAAATSHKDWSLPLLAAAGVYLDYISIHGYWDPLQLHNNPSGYLDCMMRTEKPEGEIKKAIEILDESGFRGKIKIAFDEWNLRAWHHPGHGDFYKRADLEAREKNNINSIYTMADALFSACFLNACLRNASDVEIACFSPVVNTRGAVYVHPEGVLKRTTFYTFKMYTNWLEELVVPVDSKSEPLIFGNKYTPVLDMILTSNKEKNRYVCAVVNKDPDQDRTLYIDFESIGIKSPNELKGKILKGNSPDDYNEIGAENRVIPHDTIFSVKNSKVVLPPHSLVFLIIE